MAKDQKVYMPLMIGDWLKGTRGMKAEVRGVYINLLLYQWDNGFVPSDMEELCFIDPELPKVWVKLKEKFLEFEPGKFQNKKMEEVRAFWKKQKKNGQKGGRPSKEEPKLQPIFNPEENPNNNLHIDLELDINLKLKGVFDELYLGGLRNPFRSKDITQELEYFFQKVRGSPDEYATRDTSGLRQAFEYQLRNAKDKKDARQSNKTTSGDVKYFGSVDYKAGIR